MEERHKTIPKIKLLTTIWVLIGLAIASVFLRVALRLKVLRRLFLDDGFIAVALLCNVAIGAIVHFLASDLYEQESVQYFRGKPTANYQNVLHDYATKQRAIWFLLLTSLWSIKASFILVLAKLTNDSRWVRWTWWVIAVFTALSYIGCLISYPLSNRYNKMIEGDVKGNGTLYGSYDFAVDLTFDALLILVPTSTLMRCHDLAHEQFMLVGVTVCCLLIAIVAVIHFTLCNPITMNFGSSWAILFSTIHINVGLVLACLAAPSPSGYKPRHSRIGAPHRSRDLRSDSFMKLEQSRNVESGQNGLGKSDRSKSEWPAVHRQESYRRESSEDSMAFELVESPRSRTTSTLDARRNLSHPAFAVGTTEAPDYVSSPMPGRYR